MAAVDPVQVVVECVVVPAPRGKCGRARAKVARDGRRKEWPGTGLPHIHTKVSDGRAAWRPTAQRDLALIVQDQRVQEVRREAVSFAQQRILVAGIEVGLIAQQIRWVVDPRLRIPVIKITAEQVVAGAEIVVHARHVLVEALKRWSSKRHCSTNRAGGFHA